MPELVEDTPEQGPEAPRANTSEDEEYQLLGVVTGFAERPRALAQKNLGLAWMYLQSTQGPALRIIHALRAGSVVNLFDAPMLEEHLRLGINRVANAMAEIKNLY